MCVYMHHQHVYINFMHMCVMHCVYVCVRVRVRAHVCVCVCGKQYNYVLSFYIGGYSGAYIHQCLGPTALRTTTMIGVFGSTLM